MFRSNVFNRPSSDFLADDAKLLSITQTVLAAWVRYPVVALNSIRSFSPSATRFCNSLRFIILHATLYIFLPFPHGQRLFFQLLAASFGA
jgi:hypothetical protein